MAVFSTGYCKITGLSKAMPESHYIPIMPALSQNEQAQLFGCKITMAAHMEHNYVPIIEFGRGKGLGVVACKITGHQAESVARSVPLPEEGAEIKRVHRFKRDFRYMEPFVSRLANPGERAAMEELLERMRRTSELDSAHYYVYALHDRRTGKTGMVLPYEYEEAIRSGAIESILLSGDSNSLVVRIKDGPMCTIPMDKVGKLQVERLSEEEMIFDGRGPDREIIENQRREKAAREKEDRDQMAEYLAEMERKRKERDMRKKEKMKETMKRKMEEAEEAERRQKEMDEEIKRQYEDAARIRAEAEAAKAAAREAMLAKREQKDAEARARRAEELAEQARLAEEKLQREEAERQAAEEARLAQEAAAAQALAAVDPHDMSVNELLEHMREKTEDDALLRDMEDAASIGMSSQQIADMVVTSTIEAIEEEFAEPEEEEEEVEEESEDEEEEKEKEDQLDAQAEEGEDEAEKEMLRQLREEQLEMKRKEREAKRLARQRKREEQELKDEEKRLKKEAREKKKREMMARMAAIHKADADEEAERMKKPEMREIKPRELLRRKRPENLEIPPPEEPAEYVVRTRDGKAVLTEDELDETSVIEGRISADATGRLTPGRAVKTQSGIEFVAGRIITSEGGEVFEPGQEIDLPVGPKFVPGQTVATAHGPQFVAGKTIGEGENVEFVPGHVVDLGEGKGEIFVPGQVMETDDGPKFIPGSVFRCRRAGPLFVPGQLREGEFLPGQIVETEDGPRFMSPKFPGREEQFSYVVQSFDLEQAELDLVKYQYHSPEPSPVFQGEDIGESINLMQLAARGYQAKTLPLPEQRPPPRKSKRQIYENVRVTFLDCIDSAERTRNAAAPRTLDKDELTVEARRVQRVLADDLNNPLPLTEVIGFLRKCLSLTTPTADIAGWIDGLFGHTEKGIFRPMERMRERKLSKKVSLQKTLAEIVQEMETELEEARKRDIVIVSLAKVMKKEPPLRTHVDDYRERWQEIISGILLTYGKVVLNDVFDVVAYRDADCVKTILDDVRERVASLAGDSAAVTALEHSICQYVQQNAEGRLEELFSATDDNAVPGRDGLTREILLSEGASLALLEDELDVSDCLRQCLATPALVSLLPLYHDAMEILRTLLNIHTLSTGDERRRSLLANLAKNPGFLYDSESWVTLVSGATLITQHVGIKPCRLRSANCVPDEAVALVAEFQSPEVDAVFRNVMLDASRHVHGLTPIGRADVPVMVVKNQFEGILPRHLARDVIHGRLRYLLVNEKTVKLATVGQEEEQEEHIEKQSEDATCSTGDQEDGKSDVTELKLEDEEAKDTTPCEDECICDPEEPASSSRKESTVSLPRKSSTASVSRKTSTASVSRKASTTNVSRKASTASERADVTTSELEVDTTKDEKEDKTVDVTGKASRPEACVKEEQEQDASQTIVEINVHKADDVGEDAENHVQEQTTPSGTEEHEKMDKQDAKQTDLEPTDPKAEILDGTERVACPVDDENEKVTTEEEKHEVDDSRRKDTAHEDEPTAPVDIVVDEEVGTARATQDADKIKSECADAKEDIGEVRTDVAEIKEDNARIEIDDTESKQEVDKIEISLAEVEAEIADNKLTLASPGV